LSLVQRKQDMQNLQKILVVAVDNCFGLGAWESQVRLPCNLTIILEKDKKWKLDGVFITSLRVLWMGIL
jgi:peroxiredoxin